MILQILWIPDLSGEGNRVWNVMVMFSYAYYAVMNFRAHLYKTTSQNCPEALEVGRGQ